MAYKIQPLVESNYDFASVFADKQRLVREATGVDFDLASIATFLQKQTNNFTIDNPIAHDLDNAIYDAVEKYKAETGQNDIDDKIELPPVEQTEEEKRAEILQAIELLELIGDDLDDEGKQALEILKMLV